LITAENACKWGQLRPNQDTFAFQQCDYLAEKAENASAAFRGHNLCWGQSNPGWLTSGGFSGDQLKNILQNHVDTVVKHFGNRVICWDVVNEAISDNPSPNNVFKNNLWYPALPNYIDVAFMAARNANANVKLFYNDYNGEGLGPKSDAIFGLVRDMKSRGIPIDGVGLQMHVSTSYYPQPAQISANMKRLSDLGLEIHITEMDVGCPDPCDLNLQAQIYSQILAVCLSNPSCKSFQTWGFTDGHTWLGENKHPLPFDAQYNKKPAYNQILAGLSR